MDEFYNELIKTIPEKYHKKINRIYDKYKPNICEMEDCNSWSMKGDKFCRIHTMNRKEQRCGLCKRTGHNRRSCPFKE